MFRGSEFQQNVFNIYEALNSRHGIMIIGPATSGKTTSIRIMQDVLTTLHQREYQAKTLTFQKQKAMKMGIPIENVKGDLVPKDADPLHAFHLQLTETE